jgi:GT2 family glycosyltransferase
VFPRADCARTIAVVLTWNSAEYVVRSLVSLLAAKEIDEVIVVDNASKDSTRALITANFPTVTLLNTGKNLGYAGGNNVGIRTALHRGAENVLLMNPDAYLAPGCVAELLARIEQAPGLAAVSPIILNHGTETIWFAGSDIDWTTGSTRHIGSEEKDCGQFDDVQFTARGSGCVMLFRAEALRTVGLLDERYFLYYEETDWSVRAGRLGLQIGIAPAARAYHDAHSATGGSGTPVYQYYITRNRMLFLREHSDVSFLHMTEAALRAAATPTLGLFRTQPRAALVSGSASLRGWLDFCLGRFGRRRSMMPTMPRFTRPAVSRLRPFF